MQLSDSRSKVLSEITRDTAQIFFASMFIGPLLNSGEINWSIVFSGFILAFIFWIFSLSLVK